MTAVSTGDGLSTVDRPFRVARVLGRANVGGPARTVVHLCRRLASRGFETLLLVGDTEPFEGDLLDGVDDVVVRRVPELRRRLTLRDPFAVGALSRHLVEFRPDLVHTHAAKAGLLGRLAASRVDPRPVLCHTFHGHILHGYFPRPVSAALALLERRLARRTDRLIAVSKTVRDELVDRHRVADASRFDVIENGIDLAPFPRLDGEDAASARRDARLRLGIADDGAPVVLVPARLAPIKGHDLLFAALARLPSAARPARVELLGDGPLRASLERAARDLAEDIEVRFHGFRDDLPRVLPAADVVVLPSRNEGLPLALIEAMAASLPVVATAVGGVVDLVTHGENGLLATPGDETSLALQLARVLTDLPFGRALGAAGRRRVEERHAIDRVVDQHEALYRSLLVG